MIRLNKHFEGIMKINYSIIKVLKTWMTLKASPLPLLLRGLVTQVMGYSHAQYSLLTTSREEIVYIQDNLCNL